MVIEASELRLKPGEWPESINLDGVLITRSGESIHHEVTRELISVEYLTHDGESVEVLND